MIARAAVGVAEENPVRSPMDGPMPNREGES